jgi:prepilin-type N-terminal cleavage/methylation domain-containing protein
MNVQRKEKGFTIIEVVLVLAIAGLIFLMVFIALPALQRSQRDQARKSEVGTVASAITSYQSNNRGNAPTAAAIGQYITGKTPASAVLESGSTITVRSTVYAGADINLSADLTATPAIDNILQADEILVYFGYKCDAASNSLLVRGTSRQSAVVVGLESGPSGGSVYCQTD